MWKCWSWFRFQFLVHLLLIVHVFLLELAADVENVTSVVLVAPIFFPAQLKLISECGDDSLERMSDKGKRHFGVVEQFLHLNVTSWSKMLGSSVQILWMNFLLGQVKKYFVPR